jgi:F-type H+-transporting ATPase subunit b
MEFEFNIFILQLITFVLGLTLAYFIYVPYLRGWMTERRKNIEGQIEQATKNQKDAEALRLDLERKMRELDEKTQQTLAQARSEADKARNDMVTAARKEADRILVDARVALEQEKQSALLAVRQEVGGLAVAIAEKILRSSVDPKAQQKLIDESIKELGAHKN